MSAGCIFSMMSPICSSFSASSDNMVNTAEWRGGGGEKEGGKERGGRRKERGRAYPGCVVGVVYLSTVRKSSLRCLRDQSD